MKKKEKLHKPIHFLGINMINSLKTFMKKSLKLC